MVWREPKGHDKERYFCSYVDGCNVKNKCKTQYPNLLCAVRPIPQAPGVPIPLSIRVLETVEDSASGKSWSDSSPTPN